MGHGRFGIVYAAHNVTTGALVAINCSEDPASVAEPWLVRHCQHPCVVRVLDFFASPFLTMAAMDRWDCSLRQYVQSIVLEKRHLMGHNRGRV